MRKNVASEQSPVLTLGVTVTRRHDQNTTVHYLRDNGAPMCGTPYYTTAFLPDLPGATCARCRKIGAWDIGAVRAS